MPETQRLGLIEFGVVILDVKLDTKLSFIDDMMLF